MNLFFMDECKPSQLKISSLTGILIPVGKYPKMRTEFYNMLNKFISPEIGTINMNIPELHGSNLLRDYPDDVKLDIIDEIISIVNSFQINIYRVGYFINEQTDKFFGQDKNLLGLCWGSLVNILQPVLERETIIPVMDKINSKEVSIMSGMVKSTDIIRHVNPDFLSIKNSENIFGEVFYADSNYSIFTQLVDIISYCRHINDKHIYGNFKLSSFHIEILEKSKRINMTYEEIIKLKID
ncbi:hypothetical protein [Paenibacillus physcomitrellae]|uniref:Uncharacterized protein n=1 Tax=Paenibacillus physcomitrellae TaxID=1619311 RepID=A0ABQ1FW81_9BACL|nr:hypothetical protein [Paenibacillus physcomitrellae]GGA31522.1 hypothetical protein GCM10010917_15790 [Paenibacillus physcomitrellae]